MGLQTGTAGDDMRREVTIYRDDDQLVVVLTTRAMVSGGYRTVAQLAKILRFHADRMELACSAAHDWIMKGI